MVKKFFPLDKNYLLEHAQQQTEIELLTSLIKLSIHAYELKMNPLGLMDSFSSKIRNYQPGNLEPLHDFYEKLAAIYRFKCGHNQLEFLWDGADHINHYKKNWSETFMDWVTKFVQQDLFIQAVLDLSVFLPDYDAPQLLENRMQHFIEKNMEVKFVRKAESINLQMRKVAQ